MVPLYCPATSHFLPPLYSRISPKRCPTHCLQFLSCLLSSLIIRFLLPLYKNYTYCCHLCVLSIVQNLEESSLPIHKPSMSLEGHYKNPLTIFINCKLSFCNIPSSYDANKIFLQLQFPTQIYYTDYQVSRSMTITLKNRKLNLTLFHAC